MDDSKNINNKNYTVYESIPYINIHETSNPTINNSCNINLGKTTYYFGKKTKENSYVNNSNLNKKNHIVFKPCNIIENHSFKVINSSDNGQVLIFNIKLKNICPNRLLVLGVFVYENNNLYSFKVKKFSTLGLSHIKCKNICTGPFHFVFYDKNTIKSKNIKIRFFYNYVMS